MDCRSRSRLFPDVGFAMVDRQWHVIGQHEREVFKTLEGSQAELTPTDDLGPRRRSTSSPLEGGAVPGGMQGQRLRSVH